MLSNNYLMEFLIDLISKSTMDSLIDFYRHFGKFFYLKMFEKYIGIILLYIS